jgi:hypothetical protein
MGNNMGEGGFSQTRRAIQEDVLDRFFAPPRGLKNYFKFLS